MKINAAKSILAIGILAVAVFAIATFADTSQKSPTFCTAGWTSCSNAFANGTNVATATKIGKVSDWYNYGFSIPSGSTISNVIVRADFWASKSSGYIYVQVSNNGGTTWGPIHMVGGNTVEQTYNIDVTSDFSWTPSGLGNGNFRTRATTVKVGGRANPTWNLDWIPTTVVYMPLDTQAPTVSSVTPTSANEDTATNYQVTASDNVGVTSCNFYWNGVNVGAMSFVSGNTWQKIYTENTPGSYTARGNCTDAAGNIGLGTLTTITINDVTPSGPVTNLGETATGLTWIYWTWTNPSDPDLNHIEVWLNNTFKANTTNTFYNATSLQPNTDYEIEVRPVDSSGNIGQWTTDTAFAQQQQDTQAPNVSSIYPTIANQSQQQTYKTDASDNVGVTSCDFYWLGALQGNMVLISGNAQNGIWARNYTSNSTGIFFARAECQDAAANNGIGPETNIAVT